MTSSSVIWTILISRVAYGQTTLWTVAAIAIYSAFMAIIAVNVFPTWPNPRELLGWWHQGAVFLSNDINIKSGGVWRDPASLHRGGYAGFYGLVAVI